jgi:DNA-binding NtrC family response regulator
MAERLGLHRKSLYRRMVRHGLQRPSLRDLRPGGRSEHAE